MEVPPYRNFWYSDRTKKNERKYFALISWVLVRWSSYGNFFFRRGGSATFFRVILMSLIEVQNVFLMINSDVSDQLGHVWTIFNTVGLWKSIFHRHICEDFVWKWANLSIYKAFVKELLLRSLNTLKSAHFHTKYANEKSTFATQRCRKWFKQIPTGPKHQN